SYFVQLRIAKVNTKDTDNFLQHLALAVKNSASKVRRTDLRPAVQGPAIWLSTFITACKPYSASYASMWETSHCIKGMIQL
ncbi:MAG: hypothetical protein MZW92_75935, partial [Comamonadaceae bacterium]|nr:hypothetical protein [Comamonadaceae bacterium]